MLPNAFGDRVAARRPGLSPAERRVADHLLALGPRANVLSAAALAAQIGTSDATVVRTAKALGYTGLAELRHALADAGDNPAPRDRLLRTLDHIPPDQVLSTTLDDHLAGLDDLVRDVDPASFQRAVDALTSRSRIAWRGVGPSSHLAGYAAVLAQRIGRPSHALVHTGTSFADELLGLGPDTAVVLFAYGRPQAHVQVLISRARELGDPVVLVTDTLARRYREVVHATLRAGRGRPGLFASHGTTLVLIEALILALAAADRGAADASLQTLNDLRAELAGRRVDVDTP